MENKYKIIIAHPGRQHSYYLATSLKENNLLYKYITTVYNKKLSLTNLTTFFLRGDSKKRAVKRRSPFLNDDEVKQFYEFKSIFGMFLSIFNKDIIKSNKLNSKFGKKVAQYAIANKVDAVIMYDTTASECFEILKTKAPHIKRIIDVSAANRVYSRMIFENEMKQLNNYQLKNEIRDYWDKQTIDRFQTEIENSQYALAASNFVKKSLIYSGMYKTNIKIVPYGVDINSFKFHPRDTGEVVKFLYVGRINYRKGIHRLLEAFTKINMHKCSLTLVGSIDKNFTVWERYKGFPNIDYKGFVFKDELNEIYNQSDVFVLPSLSEGMALVGLEALSCGLPLICTKNSGVNDLILDEYNGLVIPASDTGALIDSMEWFINNKYLIQDMKLNSRKTAEMYSWENYYKNINEAILEILQDE